MAMRDNHGVVEETCNAVWNKVAPCPDMLASIREADDVAGPLHTPFSSIAQMNALLLKCGKSVPKMQWLFRSILDGILDGSLHANDINITVLQTRGRISPADMALYKQPLLQELLGPVLTTFKFAPAVQQKLRVIYQDYKSFRAAFGFKQDDTAKAKGNEILWRSTLSMSEELFCGLVEKVVYGTLFDSCVKQCIKLSKVPTATTTISHGGCAPCHTLDVRMKYQHHEIATSMSWGDRNGDLHCIYQLDRSVELSTNA